MPYAHPEVLVETDWVKENIGKPGIRLVEVDVDLQAYEAGISRERSASTGRRTCRTSSTGTSSAARLSRSSWAAPGFRPKDTVVLYGDNNNWFAAYGFWLFKIYGHENVKLMNGGTQKWLNEQDKPFTTDKPSPAPSRTPPRARTRHFGPASRKS